MDPILFPLNINSVLRLLSARLYETLQRQVIDPASSAYGGWINPEHGLDEHGSPPGVLGGLWGTLWASAVHGFPLPMAEEILLHHADAAAVYQLRMQDEDGLFDLKSCNYASSPDAAFAVHRLGLGMQLVRPLLAEHPTWQPLYDQCTLFLRRAVHGITVGGFHTPNHRWVICGALSIAKDLLPDLAVNDVMDAYLAEGIDIDPDGAFTEHSTGVYDAICNLCLLLTAQFGHVEVLPAVKANLEFNLHMLNADGSAETGLSHRQDFGQRLVPLDLAAAYLLYQVLGQGDDFNEMAQAIWRGKETPGLIDLLWLAYAFQHGAPQPGTLRTVLPEFARLFPHNGFWRMRREGFSVSAFAGSERLLNAAQGGACVGSISISQSYFGVGRFRAETIETIPGGVCLRSSGKDHILHRPGYDLPLGKPVTDVYASRAQREWHALPPSHSILTVRDEGSGVGLLYETIDNHPGVLAQIALDFLPGGSWECEGGSFQPQAGQVIFLTKGFGRMRYGSDMLEIGPGADAHRYWQMRDTEPAPHHVRVIIPLITPVQHRFWVRGYDGLS